MEENVSPHKRSKFVDVARIPKPQNAAHFVFLLSVVAVNLVFHVMKIPHVPVSIVIILQDPGKF
jgi:hypothetical protein